jgi:hypothetical protein
MRVIQELTRAALRLSKCRYTQLGGKIMLIVTIILFLAPGTLLAAAWRRYFRGAEETQISQWRLYSGAVALSLASLATVLELVFFLSWFHNGGSPHGMLPSPGIWKFVGRVALWVIATSIVLALFGKGRWRTLFSVWMASICIVVPLIFMLEMD